MTTLATCRRCERLTDFRSDILARYPDYQKTPIGAWGAAASRMILVGLAPGLHGAARTGKAFVGDASGQFLFESLYECGLATSPDPEIARLVNLRITNAVKCLPPGNLPTTGEVSACREHLRADLFGMNGQRMRRNRVIICLGTLAHRAVYRCLEQPVQPFSHGASYAVRPHLHVLSCYHPSRLNVNTGRLTKRMLLDVLRRGIELAG